MFETQTKDAGPIAGVDLLRQACEETVRPVVPIGGITPENTAELVAAGAERIAVCGAICAADDPKAAAARFKQALTGS